MAKHTSNEEDFNYNSDDEHNNESLDYMVDLDEEDEDVEDDFRPPDCDEVLFNNVITLRDKRLSQEEVKNDIKKATEVLKKEIETLSKKEKIISYALTSTENEIQELQRNKQDKLNELDVVIGLKLAQYQCLNVGTMAESLVFTTDELDKLTKRINQLHGELHKLQHELKGLHKETINLAKDKVAKKSKVNLYHIYTSLSIYSSIYLPLYLSFLFMSISLLIVTNIFDICIYIYRTNNWNPKRWKYKCLSLAK